MTVDLGHPEVTRYLERLSAAAAGLPPGRREELVEEIRVHLADALAMTKTGDDAGVRAALDRLGPPEDIVAAEGMPVPGATVPTRQSAWGPVEIAAVLCLTVGAFVLPVVLPVVGVVLAWFSPAWRRRHKIIATALTCVHMLVIVLMLPFALVATTTTTFTESCEVIAPDDAPATSC